MNVCATTASTAKGTTNVAVVGKGTDAAVALDQLPIQDLTDDLLRCILQRSLASPGLLVTRAALQSRQAHISSSELGTIPFSPKRNEAFVTTQWWRSCLADTDLPATLVEHPPWSRTRDADLMYSGAVGFPPLLVCKRWLDIIASRPLIKAMVCGIQERPPPSVEVVLLAWPWPLDSDDPADATRKLEHLRTLTALSALMLWSPLPAREPPHQRNTPFTAEPALPHGLTTLRHLVYANTRGFTRPTSTAAVRASLLTLTALETLGFLEYSSVFPSSPAAEHDAAVRQLLCALPRLRTFYSRYSAVLQLQPVPALTALRHLETHVGFEDDELSMLSAQLGCLTSLESLRLAHMGNVDADDSLLALTALTRLSHLTLGSQRSSLSRELVPRLTSLPALSALTMAAWEDPESVVSPLTALCKLTALSLTAFAEDVTHRVIAALSRLSRLQALTLKIYLNEVTEVEDTMVEYADGDTEGTIRGLSTLTRLTSLVIRNCNMADGGCAALGCLKRLETLRITCCRLPEPEALHALAALQELWIRRCTDVTDAWLAAARLSSACPRLKGFCLHSSLSVDTYSVGDASMEALARLENIEELDLSQTLITDSGLRQLASLPELRFLGLRSCRNVSWEGLQCLARCKSLQCVYVHHRDLSTVDLESVTELAGPHVKVVV